MSSTIFAWCGSSSLSIAPDFPAGAKLKMEGATGRVDWPEVMPVMRWPMRTESGRSVPFHLVEVRLVVKQIDLRGSAGLMQEDDPLGFGREIGKAQ